MSFNRLIKQLISSRQPLLAVLVDPDKFNLELIKLADPKRVACFLVGGSELSHGSISKTIASIKKYSSIPVILFPGDEHQLSPKADGLFLPSLLSGRNPDYLIEKHIVMAPLIRKMKLPHLPMAYLLINGDRVSTTQKVTRTQALDPKQSTYIINTCLAAEDLGFRLIYLEAGSGASQHIPHSLIKKIKQQVSIPLIVGGGIDSVDKVEHMITTGANLIVVGNALEKNVYLLTELMRCFPQQK